MSGALPTSGGGGSSSLSARAGPEASAVGESSVGGGGGTGAGRPAPVDPMRLLLQAIAPEDAGPGVDDAVRRAAPKRPAPTAAATQAPSTLPPSAAAANIPRSPWGRKRPREGATGASPAAVGAAAGARAGVPMPAAGWLGLGSGPGSGPAPASSLPTTAPQDGLSALLAGVASIEQRQKPPPPSSLGGGSRAMGTGEKTGAATATAIAAASTASSSSPSTAGPASPPPPPPQRQQMLSALLAGLPPEASLSPPFPPPAAAPMEQQQAHPTPGLPGLPVPVVMRDPVAEAVAASREAVFRGIGLLAGQRRLDRGRTEAFLRLLTFLSQAQRRDCSVGVAGLLSHLLHSQPHVFQGTAGPPPPQQAAGIKGQELLQRLAAKEGSCHIIGTPAAAGGDAVVCNVRMVELFVCPQQLSAVLLHTGLASFFMWPLFLCKGPGLDDLYAAIMSLLLEPAGRPQMDVFLQCRTRQGNELRCLATVGAHIAMPACVGSFIALRLVTLG